MCFLLIKPAVKFLLYRRKDFVVQNLTVHDCECDLSCDSPFLETAGDSKTVLYSLNKIQPVTTLPPDWQNGNNSSM